jgi:regulator of sirC expression with transglutaminase-like and TPR domain
MMDFTTIKRNFLAEIDQPDEKISLAKAALYFAQAKYPDLDVRVYLDIFDWMAADVKKELANISYPLKVIQIINHYLFEKLKFCGNTEDYYDPRNSYLNEVIDRRTGIPISLSVVYLEIAKRINFSMVGIVMPGHFLIRPDFEDAGIFVDAFHQGEILFEQDCEKRLQQVYQQPIRLEPHFLVPASNQQILARMLTNLKFIYANRQQYNKALETIELLLLLLPNHPLEIRDRGLLYYQLDDQQKAVADLKLYLALLPNANDATAIRELLQKIQ